MNPSLLSLFVAEVKQDVAAAPTIDEKIKVAMKHAVCHWMITREDDRFKAAVGSVMDFYGKDSDEFKRLAWEIKSLSAVGVMMDAAKLGMGINSGDLESILEEREHEPIGLLGMWNAAKASSGSDSGCDGDEW